MRRHAKLPCVARRQLSPLLRAGFFRCLAPVPTFSCFRTYVERFGHVRTQVVCGKHLWAGDTRMSAFFMLVVQCAVVNTMTRHSWFLRKPSCALGCDPFFLLRSDIYVSSAFLPPTDNNIQSYTAQPGKPSHRKRSTARTKATLHVYAGHLRAPEPRHVKAYPWKNGHALTPAPAPLLRPLVPTLTHLTEPSTCAPASPP